MKHQYKGYIIAKTGTKSYPWNIYKKVDGLKIGEWVGYGKTIKECKSSIDDGCFDNN